MSSKYPISVLWNFGYQCNMNCQHCYSRVEAKSRFERMTLRQAEFIADSIIEAKALHVHFGGGEPLMRRDFLKIATKISNAGLTFSLSTNGTYLTKQIAERISALRITSVGLSLYGTSAFIHDAFTRYPGAFGKLIEALSCLKSAKVKNKFVFTLCAKTVSEIKNLFELANKLGVEEIQFYPFKIVGNAIQQLEQLRLEPENWRTVYRELSVIAKKYSKITVDFGLDNNPTIACYLGRKTLPCPCGRYSIVIKPSGSVTACGLAVRIVGNVHHRSLLDIWQNSPELLAIRQGEKNPCEVLYKTF